MGPILERLMAESEYGHYVLAAVDILTEPEEIAQFYREYVENIRTHGQAERRGNPEQGAREDIAYQLGHYGSEKATLWHEAIPGLREETERLNRRVAIKEMEMTAIISERDGPEAERAWTEEMLRKYSRD
tara:strand:+ start:2872 stop:3261 length:390 start_codon:yes stop_codon:yes gene_type:complete